MNKQLVEISKFLSFVLRHNPQAIGITLNAEGWVPIDELVAAAARHGQSISREQLNEVVATNDKKRFSFSPDGRLIRANQGHSVEVDLGLVPVEPPELLYHGTVDRLHLRHGPCRRLRLASALRRFPRRGRSGIGLRGRHGYGWSDRRGPGRRHGRISRICGLSANTSTGESAGITSVGWLTWSS